MAAYLCLLFALSQFTIHRAAKFEIKTTDNKIDGRECHGTSVGFGFSGTLSLHYHNMRKRYDGCTYVNGNLEITNLDDPDLYYDLTFLSSIRYVSGYVVIGLSTQIKSIPLLSLEMIRANNTLQIHGEQYGLVVALTSRKTTPVMGLRHLYMPQLKEISRGNVMFSQNPLLSYINTIYWDTIINGRENSIHLFDKPFSLNEERCPDVCKVNGRSFCWGNAAYLCQSVVNTECSKSCKWRCYGPGDEDCCDKICGTGCTGPGPEDCLICKDYRLDKKCVGFCPARTYPLMQTCVRF